MRSQPAYYTYPKYVADIWERYVENGGGALRLSFSDAKRARGVRSMLYTYRRMLARAAEDGDSFAGAIYAQIENTVVDAADAGGDGWHVIIQPHPAIAALAHATQAKGN